MQRDINFFTVYRSPVESDSGVDKVTMVGLILVSVCLIGLMGDFAYNKISDAVYVKQQQEITAYLNRRDVKKSQSEWNTYVNKIAALKSYENKANAETSAFKTSLPVFDSAILGTVAGVMPADVKVIDTSYSGGAFILKGTSADNLSPANFVYSLKGTGKFEDVTYNSVKLDNGAFNFSITCTMKGVGGK